MGLSEKAIEELKRIYSQEFEKDISDEKAKELGNNLIELFKIIYRPVKDNKEEDL